MEYLAAHPSFKIKYRSGMKLVDLWSGYADAEWGKSSSRRSTSGIVMLYNKSPIMWKSKMQKTTALSTAEAEYYSASAAGCEVFVPQIPSAPTRIRAEEAYPEIRGQRSVY